MEMNRKMLASVFFIGLLAFAALPPALAQPSLALNPSIGPPGTIVAVSGSGFAAGVHRVYFDTDGDGSHGSCEPFKYVFVGAPGTFTTTLTVPPVPSGAYFVRADVWPYTAPAEASAPFTVKTIFEELLEIEGKLWSWADSLKNETKAIEAKLDNPTYGLSAIKTYLTGTVYPAIDEVEGLLKHATYGLSALNVDLDAILTRIGSATTGPTTIMGKLEDIKGELKGWFDPGGTIESYVDDIETYLGTWPYDWDGGGPAPAWANVAAALGDMKTELTGWFDATTGVIDNKIDGVILDIGTWPTPNFADMDAFADWLYGELITKIAAKGHGWTDLASALDDIKDELGQGLVGEHGEDSVTMDGLWIQIWTGPLPSLPFTYDGGKKLSFYIDTSNMNSTCTIEIQVYMDVDDDGWITLSPGPDIIEDALHGKAYDFTFSGVQAYNSKLIVDQLPISRWTIVYIRGTAGLVIHYHWILEEA